MFKSSTIPNHTPRSFAAEMAKTPIKANGRWFVGVDPDGHDTGVAWLHAAWTSPLTGPVVISEVHAGLASIPKNLRGLDAVDAMVGALSKSLNDIRNLTKGKITLVAEAQQVYPREEMARAELVAKANDLLKLAQITGAALAIADRFSWDYTSELPAQWKQQKKKDAHHKQIEHRLRDVDVLIGGAFSLLNRPAKYGHAMDAIGLALWAADRESSGTLEAHIPAP